MMHCGVNQTQLKSRYSLVLFLDVIRPLTILLRHLTMRHWHQYLLYFSLLHIWFNSDMGSNFSKQTQSKTCSMPECTCTVCVHCKHTEHTENVSSFRINMVRRSSRSRSRGREVNYIIYYYYKLRDHLYKSVIHGPKLESGLRVLKKGCWTTIDKQFDFMQKKITRNTQQMYEEEWWIRTSVFSQPAVPSWGSEVSSQSSKELSQEP